MKRSLILSNLRVELRRKQADYITEKLTINWVVNFLDELSIIDSSQIRSWQKEYFMSKLKSNKIHTGEELLQAKSSLLFLYEKVLNRGEGINSKRMNSETETEPGLFRVTG